MEDGRVNALISRDRCLEAIVAGTDFETARALWRAAKRYNAGFQERRSGLESRATLHRALGVSGGPGSDRARETF